ncbi:hypothetical protein C8F04DRAFT_1181729 [Mycena alexandri]|uniref:Uncharacterized protein n=1 Tax=Mycena alexandri TaxID=1745969 RepID=A0AAD6X4B7_9AGAR|nr:hypothetical protein C8F04DRAFT_1181729 [Mycena alexandri]
MTCYIPRPVPTSRQPQRPEIYKIIEEFPFFPFFHNLYSTHANVNPTVVITGVGPSGRKIAHLQPPRPNHLIDPSLLNLQATPLKSRGDTPSPWSPSPVKTPIYRSPLKENRSPNTEVKPKIKKDTPLSEAILRVRNNVKMIPAKGSLEDTLVSMHEHTMKQAVKRAALQDDIAQRHLMLDEKAQLIEMQQMGNYTKDEFLAQLKQIEARYAVATKPSPAKCPRLSGSSNAGSSSDIEFV